MFGKLVLDDWRKRFWKIKEKKNNEGNPIQVRKGKATKPTTQGQAGSAEIKRTMPFVIMATPESRVKQSPPDHR